MNKVQYYLLILLFFLLKSSFSQAPVANFSQNATQGCGMLVVSFQDLSTNTPTSWMWNFGDGFTSVLQNPTHAYTAPGIYTVKLTATNASGSNMKTVTNLITVFERPTVAFHATSDTIGCQPFATAFTPQVTGPVAITQYTWDYGDGQTSGLMQGDHTYNTPGVFSVTLTVRDANQCTGAKTHTSYITVKPKPVAQYSATPVQACAPPLVVGFTDNSTGNGLTYLWNFGDGSPISTNQSPSHTYTSSGQFSPTLIVQNDVGCTDTLQFNNYINVVGFNVGFSASTTQGCTPFQTLFTGNNGQDVIYNWDFGDGNTGIGPQIWHQYSTAGYFDVTVVATNANGCIDTMFIDNYIHTSSGSNITFSANDTVSCNIPFTVNFTNTTVNSQSCIWSFGDGNTSTANNPSHTYTAGGAYSVTLTVVDSLGCSNWISKTNYININMPAADISADVKKGCIPLTVNFTDISTISPPTTSWHWDFGDGQTSTGQNPTHIYSDTGHYNVSLIIVNSEGCSDTITFPNYIKAGIHPTAAFVGDSLFGCHPLKTQFTDQSSDFVNEWHWYFVDDGESTEQDPMHTFQDTLFGDVALVVYNNGCQDSLMKEDYIYVRFPKPIFTSPAPTSCFAPYTVSFNNTSIGATDYLWRFGDGATDTLLNVSHTYTNPGMYSVELRVFNDTNMCADSTKQTFLVKISDVHAGFNFNPPIICQYDSVHFYDNSNSYFSINSYKWYFGDGFIDNNISGDTAVHQYETSGVFNLKLIITDSLGCTDTRTLPNALTVNPLPSPRFSADHTQGCPPFTAQFTDLSFNQLPSTMVAWLWNFGDDSTSTVQNPTHIFADTGSYTITLTVTDDRGCDSTYSIPNYINLGFPTPMFSSDTLICSGDTLCMTNHSTGDNISSVWDFGDGTPTSTLADVTHAFNVDSTRVVPVTLTVTDQWGCSKSYIRNITVSKPVARFGALSQTSDCPPFTAQFVDSSSTDVISWEWIFGDPISGNNNVSYFQTPQHFYANSGVFDVSLSVINTLGCKDTTVIPDYIFVDGPRGTFDFNPKVGCAPLTVTFTSNTENTADYLWVFGDGGSATGSTITWTYTDGGFYLPVLVLRDSLNTAVGDTAICSVTIVSNDTVRVVSGMAEFSITDSLYCINQLVQFTDASTGNGAIAQWLWEFGDDSTSTQQNPTHAYASPGDYIVNFTVWVDSCTQTIAHLVHVFAFPDVLVNITDTIGCSPFETEFYVIPESVVPNGTAWSWNFEDGSDPVPSQNADHQYQQSGNYSTALTVTFANGCVNTYHYPVNITVYPTPDAEFIFDGNYVKPGVPIHFTDQSTGDIFSWFWSFGDGNTETIPNPTHSYPNSGYHRVSLIVTSSHGCQDSVNYTLVTTEGIRIPNVFTPNNDGVNDYFFIETYGEFELANMKIFNRWGILIWETDSPIEFWDGKTRSGNEFPSSTYFYVYNAKSSSGKTYESSGSVTLIR